MPRFNEDNLQDGAAPHQTGTETMTDTTHLVALVTGLHKERARLALATGQERELRTGVAFLFCPCYASRRGPAQGPSGLGKTSPSGAGVDPAD